MFSQASVSHSVHRERGCLADTPSPQAHIPWADTPPADTPLPSAYWDTHTPAQCMLGYTSPPAATAADGTHPTGMHSCFHL